MRVGINLLCCALAENPVHLRALQYALWSLLDSDLQEHDAALMIVDSGSTCEEARLFMEAAADALFTPGRPIWLSRFEENLGIAKGRNIAESLLLERWHPEVTVEVHTDHIFPRRWLSPMVETLERPGFQHVGILGPALLSGRSLGQWSLGTVAVDYLGESYQEVRERVEREAASLRRPEVVVPGLTHPALKRAKMLEAVGLYDEAMPGLTNFEDTEQAYRAHQAGWGICIDRGSVVFHHYTLTRMPTNPHAGPGIRTYHESNADFAVNGAYCYEKHGQAFWEWATHTLGGWMDSAYREGEA